jgi:glycosyltransferase involved in cell wall biosynthesis
MFVSDQSGSAFYRCQVPGDHWRRQGAEITVETSIPGVTFDHERAPGKVLGLTPLDCDVVVLQRPTMNIWRELVPLIKRQCGLVVEIDDDLHAMPVNLGYRQRITAAPDESIETLMWCAKHADVVTASTPRVCARYGHRHGRVVRNTVPEAVLQIPRNSDGRTIGWSGSVASHPGDLEVTEGQVARAVLVCNWHFLCVGDGLLVDETLRLPAFGYPDGDNIEIDAGYRNTEVTGWLPAGEHYYPLARLDIGIAPLKISQFTQAKSAIKILEYMALGVIPVGSLTNEYKELTPAQSMWFAEVPKDWYFVCHGLMTCDPDTRQRLSDISRKYVADKHTIACVADQWMIAWSAARSIAKARARQQHVRSATAGKRGRR